MKKVTLRLDSELDQALERLAARRGVSKAEVIRVALWDAAAAVERPRITAIGVTAGPGDVADQADWHLETTDFGR